MKNWLIIFLCLLASPCFAQDSITLAWDTGVQPEGIEITGYKVYMGSASGSYSSSWEVGNVLQTVVGNLNYNTNYYFAATALGNVSENGSIVNKESVKSNEVVYFKVALPICGDGSCNGTETCSTCAKDCGVCKPKCGNRICEPGETWWNCWKDCKRKFWWW